MYAMCSKGSNLVEEYDRGRVGKAQKEKR